MECDDLVASGLHICRQEARRWRHTPFDEDDLLGEAMVALVKAAKRYDPSYEVPFTAFATRAVRGALQDLVRKAARRESLGDGRFVEVHSLDRPVQRSHDERERELVDSHTIDEVAETLDTLRLLATIPERERYVLIRTVIDGADASEVAKELGVGVDRVYRLSAWGSARLRIRRKQAA